MQDNQLRMTAEELKEVGFIEHISHVIGPYSNGIVLHELCYKKTTINGFFSYCSSTEYHPWSHVTIIGKTLNSVQLDVEHFNELKILFKIFKV